MKVLIVEDDMHSLRMMHAAISPLAECTLAKNGFEAIDSYHEAISSEHQFDMIFLDIMMPDISGHEVLKIIRSHERQHSSPYSKEVKIVMTTAFRDCKNLINSFENKCDGYLVKPIELEALLDMLKLCKVISDTVAKDYLNGCYHGNRKPTQQRSSKHEFKGNQSHCKTTQPYHREVVKIGACTGNTAV
jgi:two-component system chemotaxis response regulator CheY